MTIFEELGITDDDFKILLDQLSHDEFLEFLDALIEAQKDPELKAILLREYHFSK